MKLEVALIRHGQIRQARTRLVGVTNEPLGEEGAKLLREKSAAGVYPEASLVFSSRLSRCYETARVIYGEDIHVITLEKLDAPNYGDFDGREYSELATDESYIEWSKSVEAGAFPNGENPQAIFARSHSVFKNIMDEMASKGLGRVSVITHRVIIQSILKRYCVPRSNYEDWEIPYGGGYLIRYDTEDDAVEVLNKF